MQIDNLWLGVQTSNDHNAVILTAFWKCQVWASKRAKSFTFRFYHTDYHGIKSDKITGYATLNVTYYSDKSSGKNLVLSENDKQDLRKFVDNYNYRLVRINAYEPDQRFVELPTTENVLTKYPIHYGLTAK